jgi:hypothetical protein
MKMKRTGKYNTEYLIIVTTSFPLFFSRKEEDEGTIIPHDLIENQVMKQIKNKEYEVNEESMN